MLSARVAAPRGDRSRLTRRRRSRLQAGGTWVAEWDPELSRISLFGIQVGVKSVGQACGFISVFLQLTLFMFFGGIADYGGMRTPAGSQPPNEHPLSLKRVAE